MKTSEKIKEIIHRARHRKLPHPETHDISNKKLSFIHAKKINMKAKCFWIGFLRGLIASDDIVTEELEPLVIHTCEFLTFLNDDDANELLTEISLDWDDVREEAEALVENILEFREQEAELDEGYNATNYFQGFLKGIACDNRISYNELSFAASFLSENEMLFRDQRVEDIKAQIDLILSDGEVDEQEPDEICFWISRLVGSSFADTGLTSMTDQAGSEDYVRFLDVNRFEKAATVLTGVFSKNRSRKRIVDELEKLGANIKNTVSKKTNFLIVADEASKYWATPNAGTKLLKAHNLKQETGKPELVSEHLIKQLLDDV